jgi:hypothetical protein
MIREFNSEAESSSIHSVRYDDETLEMQVNFKNSKANTTYGYKNVPVNVFEQFESAESKGKSFIELFHNKYEFVKLNHTPS